MRKKTLWPQEWLYHTRRTECAFAESASSDCVFHVTLIATQCTELGKRVGVMLCQVLSQMQVRHLKSRHVMRFSVLHFQAETNCPSFFLSAFSEPPSTHEKDGFCDSGKLYVDIVLSKKIRIYFFDTTNYGIIVFEVDDMNVFHHV